MKRFPARLKALRDWVSNSQREINFLLTRSRYVVLSPEDTDVVVSMTSYPARIRHAWLAIESLFRQDYPAFSIVLVLTKSQFPEKRLPAKIRHQQKRGLRVIWVDKDGRSSDHIWPAYSMFPEKRIVSVDDDKFFPPDLLSSLVEESKRFPKAIIGARGWQMSPVNERLEFGNAWTRADTASPSRSLFIPPGNGTLYPPGSLSLVAGDFDLMIEVCPTADDVWFWATATLVGSDFRCLGMPPHPPVQKQLGTESLASLNEGPRQFRRAIEHFGIEERLILQIQNLARE